MVLRGGAQDRAGFEDSCCDSGVPGNGGKLPRARVSRLMLWGKFHVSHPHGTERTDLDVLHNS